MYPRNAASPERIAIGAVVQISDGAVQTSGVTITVRGQGGAEATGGNSAVFGASGVVYYTPTQAETDFTSFVVIASKTGCIPVAQTLITTASATPGTVLLAPVTHTSAVVPTVTTTTTATNLTNLPTIPANWLTAAGIATGAIDADALAADAVTEIRDKIIERTCIRGAVTTGTLSTTTCPTTGMSPAMTAANQLQGQILMFDFDTTTAALRGQKTDILTSSAAANPVLTFTALTTAPASGDTFTIG